jgi:NAD(P)-dependent dehydrogenase (short-subunit alcohol dehydrogenase family)
MRRFVGKHALVFGGNSGIGLAAARGLAGEGARVTITGRDPATLRSAAEAIGAEAIRSDIAKRQESVSAVAEAVKRHGPIDVLFVNAGVGAFAAIPEVSEALWDDIHSVNLRGCFFAAQAALPHLRDGGAIVFTGSIGAVLAIPGNAAYAAAKSGLRALVRIFAAELMPRSIRVNMVSPGPTETPIINRNPGMTPEAVAALRQMMIDNVPMKRLGEADEIARAVLFLASEEASFITGVELFVDGGVVALR